MCETFWKIALTSKRFGKAALSRAFDRGSDRTALLVSVFAWEHLVHVTEHMHLYVKLLPDGHLSQRFSFEVYVPYDEIPLKLLNWIHQLQLIPLCTLFSIQCRGSTTIPLPYPPPLHLHAEL